MQQIVKPQAGTTDRMTPEFVTIRSVKQELEHTFTLVMDRLARMAAGPPMLPR